MEDEKLIKIYVKYLVQNKVVLIKLNSDDVSDNLYLRCFEFFKMSKDTPLRLIHQGNILDPTKSLQQNGVHNNSFCYLYSPERNRRLSVDEDAVNALLDNMTRDFGLTSDTRIILYVNNPVTGEMVQIVRTPTVPLANVNQSNSQTTDSHENQQMEIEQPTIEQRNTPVYNDLNNQQPNNFPNLTQDSLMEILQRLQNNQNEVEHEPEESQITSPFRSIVENVRQIRRSLEQNGLRENQQRRETTQSSIDPIPSTPANSNNVNSPLPQQLPNRNARSIHTISFQIFDAGSSVNRETNDILNPLFSRLARRHALRSVNNENNNPEVHPENNTPIPQDTPSNQDQQLLYATSYDLLLTLIDNRDGNELAKQMIQLMNGALKTKETIIGNCVNQIAIFLTSVLSESTNENKQSLTRDVLNILYYNLYEFYCKEEQTPQYFIVMFKKTIFDIFELEKKYSLNDISDLFHRIVHQIVHYLNDNPNYNNLPTTSPKATIETEEYLLKALKRCYDSFKSVE